MKCLVAFDKFKDCMSAERACEVARKAILRALPSAQVFAAPLTDGGDGFCEILTTSVGGRMENVEVTGPCGERVMAEIGFVDIGKLPESVCDSLHLSNLSGELALVEMAQASGLWRVPVDRRNPWTATSRGTGELIAHVAKHGAKAILLGIGGSATCDLGLGALDALGLECVATGKSACGIVPDNWDSLTGFRGGLMPLPPIYVACDVSNPLVGPNGAAAVFGPQKGLKHEDIARMDDAMTRVGRLLFEHFARNESFLDMPCGGAAGGIGLGLYATLSASFVPGAELVRQWLDLDRLIDSVDLVVTGEGRFDASSLSGKGPGEIVRLSQAVGRRVVVFAGSVDESVRVQAERQGGDNVVSVSIMPDGMTLAESVKNGESLLGGAVETFFRR